MKILFTGAGGQLGGAFKDECTYKNLDVTYTTRAELDISDRTSVDAFFEKNAFDVIINAAAYTDVDGAEDNRELAISVNHAGPMNLVQAARKTNAKIIQISTDYVFSGRGNKPYLEGETTHSINAYGKSKEMGEAPILRYDHGIVLRTSWLYSFSGKNFVRTMISLFEKHDEVSVISDQIGCPTSAWSLSKAILTMISQLAKIPFGPQKYPQDRIFHYVDSGIASWYDLACAIQRFYKHDSVYKGFPCKVTPITTSEYPTPAERPRYSVLSTKKFQKVFGIIPGHWQDELSGILQTSPKELLY